MLTTSTESRIAANFGSSAEGLDAAEAIVELSLAEIVAVPDWNQLLNGSVRSSFVDGASIGSRPLADGSLIDLSQIVNMANCEAPTPCSAADMDADDGRSAVGAEQSALDAVRAWPAVGRPARPDRLAVLCHPDGRRTTRPKTTTIRRCDGTGGTNPGTGVIALRAEAFGVGGTHKAVELTVARDGGVARVLTWHEVR